MRKRLKTSAPFLVIIVAVFFCIQWIYNPTAQESIIFFPIDQDAEYTAVSNQLILDSKKQEDSYTVQWTTSSKLNQIAYLRQDIGFLFFNGKLKAKINKWKQSTAQLSEEISIYGNDSKLIQSISFHYSEIHPNETDFTSAQKMTMDQLYVIDSNFSPFISFRTPQGPQEKEWEKILNRVTNQQLHYWWEKGIEKYQLNLTNYQMIPLTDLSYYNTKPLQGFTKGQWDRLIGNLWEGLYKNYFLGIKKENGTVVDSLDSTIPLILIDREQNTVLVLTITKDGEPVLLKQQIL
jgi:hypothetical protein